MTLFVLLLLNITLLQVMLPAAQHVELTPTVASAHLKEEVLFVCTKNDPLLQIAWDTPFAPNIFSYNTLLNLSIVIEDVSSNNSVVFCVGRYLSQPTQVYYSNPGKIIIENTGLITPAEVSIDVVKLNACMLKVIWSIPSGDFEVLGYHVNITNLDNNTNVTDASSLINETSVHIPLGYDYIVSVAAVNDVGKGNISVTNINSTDAELSHFSILYVNQTKLNLGKEWNIEFKFNASRLICPEGIQVLFFDNLNGKTFNPSKVFVDQTTLSSGAILLPENVHYALKLFYEIGKFNYQDVHNFTTFDVQKVRVSFDEEKDQVCFDAILVNGSNEKCQTNLSCLHNSLDNSSMANDWCQHLPNINDTCFLMAFDVENKMVEFDQGPAFQTSISINGGTVVISATESSSAPTGTNQLSHVSLIYLSVAVATSVVLVLVLFMLTIAVLIIKKRKATRKIRSDVKMPTKLSNSSITLVSAISL